MADTTAARKLTIEGAMKLLQARDSEGRGHAGPAVYFNRRQRRAPPAFARMDGRIRAFG